MRPYGVRLIENPDVADLQEMGAKSSAGRLPGKGGECRGYANGNQKGRARRRWKRAARAEGKAACRDY